jgi:hypothetical protein
MGDAKAEQKKPSRDGNILGDTDKETVGCSVMISYSRKDKALYVPHFCLCASCIFMDVLLFV